MTSKGLFKSIAALVCAMAMAIAAFSLSGCAAANTYTGTTWYSASASQYDSPRFDINSFSSWTEPEYAIDLESMDFTESAVLYKQGDAATGLTSISSEDWNAVEASLSQMNAYEYEVQKDGTAATDIFGSMRTYEIKNEDGKKVLYIDGRLWGYATLQDAIDAAYAESGITV